MRGIEAGMMVRRKPPSVQWALSFPLKETASPDELLGVP
jgi:hypothetical protein